MANTPTIIIFRSIWGWSVAALLGAVSSVLLIQIPGFPMMLAAQITAGIMGLAGGLAFAFIIRRTVGRMSWQWVVFLAIAWTLSCVLGVSPLFLTSGTPQMMAVLTFYSFAVFSTLGAVATVYAMKPLLTDTSSRDAISSVGLWSFGFCLASLAANFVGDGLSRILPAWFAWAIAYEAMALIIGIAGGGAILRYLTKKSRTDDALGERGTSRRLLCRENDQRSLIILITLCLPFYLNDLTDIYINDWRVWLTIDYITVKLFPILVIAWLVRNKKMTFSEFGLTTQLDISFLSVFFIGALIGSFIEQAGYPIMNKLIGNLPLGTMPVIASPVWYWIDLTFGLLLTAICEELIFRGYLKTFLSHYTKRTAIIVGTSALAFALIHWSGGYEKVIVTFAAGAFFMLLYLQTRSLPAIMLAHFAIDFIDFSHLMPKFIFSP